MLMRLVNASNLIGCGRDIKQSEPIRNKLGVQRGADGAQRGAEGHGGVHGGACRAQRDSQKGCRGV